MTSLNKKINKIIIESNEDVSLLFSNLKGDIFCECKKNEQVVSASTIKTPIMLAVLEEVRKGNVKLDDMIYVDEHVLLEDSKVFEYNFRDKTNGWEKFSNKIIFKDKFKLESFKDNLLIFDSNFENIVNVCKYLDIYDYIINLENGFETILVDNDFDLFYISSKLFKASSLEFS